MANRARGVARRFSEFATLTTKPTTVLAAKPGGRFLRIEVCPGCCDLIGRVRWMSWKLLSADRIVSVVFNGGVNQMDPVTAARFSKTKEQRTLRPVRQWPTRGRS